MTGLVALAIVGVLLMHGLDGVAAAAVDTDHHTARHDDGGAVPHGVFGICVFVITGTGLIARGPHWPLGRCRPDAGSWHRILLRLGPSPVTRSQECLLFELCVMRV